MAEAPTSLPVLTPREAMSSGETRLVEVVDRLLDRGVVVRGELWLTVADVELVFLGADLVLASPEAMRSGRIASKDAMGAQ
jgi:hypothetical protein